MTIKHPGTIINATLRKLHVSVDSFAVAMGMHIESISPILEGNAEIAPETALRLETVLKEPAEHWMALQAAYDINVLRKKEVVEPKLLTALVQKPAVDKEGYHGLSVWSSAFEICAKPFDARIINREDEVPGDVFVAFKSGHKAGYLRGIGNFAYSKKTQKFGFLMTSFLERHRDAGSIDLGSIGQCMGVDLVCFDGENVPPFEDRIYLTAFIDSPERFKDAPEISVAMSKIAFNWNVVHNLDIPSQLAGANQ